MGILDPPRALKASADSEPEGHHMSTTHLTADTMQKTIEDNDISGPVQSRQIVIWLIKRPLRYHQRRYFSQFLVSRFSHYSSYDVS